MELQLEVQPVAICSLEIDSVIESAHSFMSFKLKRGLNLMQECLGLGLLVSRVKHEL